MTTSVFTKLQTKFLEFIVKKTIYPLIEAKKYKEAIIKSEEMQKKYPELEILKYTLALADYRYKKETAKEDIEKYTQAIAFNPNNPELYFKRAKSYETLESYLNAINDYTKSIELDPNNPEAYYNRGAIYSFTNNKEKTIEDYTKIIELDPDYPNIYAVRAREYAELGHFEKAISDCNAAIKQKPNCSWLYERRGTAYYYMKNFEKALEDYTRMIELDPQIYKYACKTRAELYINFEQYDKAIIDYTEAIKHNPDSIELYKNRGMAYCKVHKYQEGLEDYNQVIKLNPKDANSYLYRCTINEELQNYESAIDDCNKAFELKTDFPEFAYSMLGYINIDINNFNEALANIEKAISINNQAHHLYCYRGSIKTELLNFEEALEDFNEGFKDCTVSQIGQTWTEIDYSWFLYNSISNFKMNNFEEAKSDLEKLLYFEKKFDTKKKDKLVKILLKSDKWGNDYIEFCKSILYSYPDNELAKYCLNKI